MGALPTQDPTLLSSSPGVPLRLRESQTHVGDETQSESEDSIPGGKKSITIMNFITFLVGKKKIFESHKCISQHFPEKQNW